MYDYRLHSITLKTVHNWLQLITITDYDLLHLWPLVTSIPEVWSGVQEFPSSADRLIIRYTKFKGIEKSRKIPIFSRENKKR
jgi:hypothetical protein